MGIQREKKILAEIVELISIRNRLKQEKYKKKRENLDELEKLEKKEYVKNLKKIIGLRVMDIRARNGLSQESFAVKSSVNTLTISRIERGKTLISVDTLINIAKTFSVSADYLLGLTSHEEAVLSSAVYKQLEDAQILIDRQDQQIKELYRKFEELQNTPGGKKRIILLRK